jgi:hypothetical protein
MRQIVARRNVAMATGKVNEPSQDVDEHFQQRARE